MPIVFEKPDEDMKNYYKKFEKAAERSGVPFGLLNPKVFIATLKAAFEQGFIIGEIDDEDHAALFTQEWYEKQNPSFKVSFGGMIDKMKREKESGDGSSDTSGTSPGGQNTAQQAAGGSAQSSEQSASGNTVVSNPGQQN